MSYLVDKRPIAYRNPREKIISYPHDILLKKNLLWICIFNSGVIASEFRKKSTKKNRTTISVYSSYYVGVKLSSVSSVPDEYVLRLLRNGEKG